MDFRREDESAHSAIPKPYKCVETSRFYQQQNSGVYTGQEKKKLKPNTREEGEAKVWVCIHLVLLTDKSDKKSKIRTLKAISAKDYKVSRYFHNLLIPVLFFKHLCDVMSIVG